MISNIQKTIVLVLTILTGSILAANGESEWINIKNPEKVQKLVNGKTMDGKYWMHYYRGDGNMAYYYVATKAMSVRKWKVESDGKLCVAIFKKPDRVIDCFNVLQAKDDTTKFQLKWSSGINAFQLLDEPPENMAKAVNDIAGKIQ